MSMREDLRRDGLCPCLRVLLAVKAMKCRKNGDKGMYCSVQWERDRKKRKYTYERADL